MTSSTPDPRTAGELLHDLEREPAYQERQRVWQAQEAENRRRYADAAAGLLADLRAAGFDVDTMGDLRQPGVGDRTALPALVAWLPVIGYPPLKRDLIATLGSAWARPAAAPRVGRRVSPHRSRRRLR